MLAKIAPKFVISRVIQSAYYANFMSIEIAKQIIGQSALNFYWLDAKKYYECNFYGYISSLPAPTEFSDQFQKQKYEEAVQKFKEYNNVRQIYQKLNEYTLQLREIYRNIEANNSSANLFARSSNIDAKFEEDIIDALDRYNLLLKNLEPYPEWKDKVVEQVGKWLHVIHNNLAQSETKHQIFTKLNRQDYFV